MKTFIRTSINQRHASGTKQRGVVIVITLIILVAMTLGALVMMRATDTATLVAGNLAFKQSTINSSNVGIEVALNWLEQQQLSNPANLYTSASSSGYTALREDPDYRTAESWDSFWSRMQTNNQTCAVQWTGSPAVASCGTAATQDAAGNSVSYVIHRLCANQSSNADPNAGNPSSPTSGCSTTLAQSSLSNDHGAGAIQVNGIVQVYYRVTLRVAGPNNTVTYTQVNTAL